MQKNILLHGLIGFLKVMISFRFHLLLLYEYFYYNSSQSSKKIGKKKERRNKGVKAYLRIIFSQEWYPTFFRLLTVDIFHSSGLPVRRTILNPSDNNSLYRLRLAGNAGALLLLIHSINNVTFIGSVLTVDTTMRTILLC